MENNARKAPWGFRLICRLVRLFSPQYRLYGLENLPAEPCVIVGNHAQMYGPIAAELFLPRERRIWCIGEMMRREEVPAYAYQEFWSGKPASVRWFYRLLSHMIAPLSEYLFTHAHTIPVYRDVRVMTTFRQSMAALGAGEDIVIYPESHEDGNGILWRFQERFADLAGMYYKKTGNVLSFVPMYIAPRLKRIHFGTPVKYQPGIPMEEERTRICAALTNAITDMAVSLPRHVVVPYVNVPKSQYPTNTLRR